MKRILIFSLAYHPHIGGAEVALKEITDRISDIEFHVLTLNFGGERCEERIGNVFVHRVGNGSSYLSKLLFPMRAAWAARVLHRAHHFDAFWAMMSYMLFPIVLLRLVKIRIPYLLTLQEGDSWEHMFSRWFILPLRPLLSSGFRNASEVQAISTYLAQWAKRIGYTGRVEVIPNGCDTARFGEKSLTESVQHQVLHRTMLVTTSRLVHKNALDDVIRALALLHDTVHFRIYGSGSDEQELKRLARELGVESRVEFMGHIDHAELPRALSTGGIFIRPSRSEGMGNSFIEAMAVGLPVIATLEGGIADFLFDPSRNNGRKRHISGGASAKLSPDEGDMNTAAPDYKTGWAVDKDSPEQIAGAVEDILAHPEQVARVKVTAKALVLEKYDWNLIAKNMRALLVRIMGKTG